MTHSIATIEKPPARGEFRRDMLPDAETYFAAQGLQLIGRSRQRMAPCPVHGGSDSLSVDTDTGRFLCFACGAKGGDMLALHRQALGLSFIEAARDLGAWVKGDDKRPPISPRKAQIRPQATPEPRPLPETANRLRRERQPLHGSTGHAYLRARGCAIPPDDGDLYTHSALRHPSGYTGPALLALISDAVTGEPMGVHRTWVTPTAKADLKAPKMSLGPKQGGVIRLWPDEAVTTGLAIAEGIETALTIAHHYRPVWCVIDAGNMAAFPVLPGIECLVIGADNDKAGINGAHACADRWARAGRDVRVILPDATGADWNDAGRPA